MSFAGFCDKESRACSWLHDLRLKNVSNVADIIVQMKAAEITNYNTCIVKTKNIRTSSRIQMISLEEIRRVEFHSKVFLNRLNGLLFLNTSNGESTT
jgi:hypothetical protein